MKRHQRHRGSSQAAVRARNERFVEAYFATGENATQAYLAVNPKVTTGSAAVEGHKLLKLPKIQQAIEERRQELRRRFALTADRVLQELERVSFFTAKKLVDAKGQQIPLHKLDDDTAAALAAVEMEVQANGTTLTRWRPFDKVAALEKAAKILRLYDKPPPPPPDEELEQDEEEVARRLAFWLAKRQKQLTV